MKDNEQAGSNQTNSVKTNYQMSPEELATYQDQGYIIFKNLYDSSEIGEIRDCADRIKISAFDLANGEYQEESKTAHNINSSSYSFKNSQYVLNLSDEQPAILRVVWAGGSEPDLIKYGRSEKITHKAAQIIDNDQADHLINQLHFKLPHDGVEFLWHKDIQNRMAFDKDWQDVSGNNNSYVVFIAAIDANTIENGPLYVIPGSHKLDFDFPRFSQTEDIAAYVDTAKAVPVLLEPGDVAAFHSHVLHASWPNESENSRTVFINGFSAPGANHVQYPGIGSNETIFLSGDHCSSLQEIGE